MKSAKAVEIHTVIFQEPCKWKQHIPPKGRYPPIRLWKAITQYITVWVHVYISSSECRKKKEGERKTSILERGEGGQLHLLTGWVRHEIQRKTKNVYQHCYQKNPEKATWEDHESLEDNIKIGDKVYADLMCSW